MPKLSNLLAFAVSVLLSAIGLELGFRAYEGAPVFALTDWRGSHVTVSASMFDPMVGWVQKSNLSGPGFNTIDYGIRKNAAADTGVRAGGILVVGDSFAAGSQVTDEDTWPAQLEELVRQPVINAAVGGYGVDQMVLRAEQILPLARPKAIILSTLATTISEVTYSSWGEPKPYFTVAGGSLVFHAPQKPPEVPRRRRSAWWKRLLGHAYLVDQLMGRYVPNSWYSELEQKFELIPEDDVEIACLLLRRLWSDADPIGARVLLVLEYGGSVRSAGDTRPADAAMLTGCAGEAGVQVVDAFDTLHDLAVNDPDTFRSEYVSAPGDTVFGHMSPKGNRLIAGLIDKALREAPPVPAANPTPLSYEITGDGINRVAEATLDNPPTPVTASLTRVAGGPPAEYEVTALGSDHKGEHSVGLALSPSTAGPYMLTMQARTTSSANLWVSIVDGGNNGTIGQFELSRDRAMMTRLGNGRDQKVAIAPLADGWHDISVTSIVPGEEVHVVIQLIASHGQATFKSAGQQVFFRQLRVEGGSLEPAQSTASQ